MSKSPTFGFSAFLKLVSLSETPQRAAVRDRYKPSDGKGYDYHRSLRLALRQISGGTHSASQVLSSLSSIKQRSERHSAKRGVIRYMRWQMLHPGNLTFCPSIVIDSPAKVFKIRFDADFVTEIAGQRVAIHVWNTKRPKLSRNLVLASLSLVQQHWPKDQDTADDFAVLSLQDMKLYRWSEDPAAYKKAAENLMLHIETLCSAVANERSSIKITPEDRPSPEV